MAINSLGTGTAFHRTSLRGEYDFRKYLIWVPKPNILEIALIFKRYLLVKLPSQFEEQFGTIENGGLL